MCENNNNYSEIAEAYRNYRDNFYNNTSFLSSECECNRDRDRDCDRDRDRDRDRDDRRLCCGRRFDNSPIDERKGSA